VNGDDPVEQPEGEKKYHTSQILALQREVKELKDDLASLYAMIMGYELDDLNIEDLRTLINLLRMDKRHVLQHKNRLNEKARSNRSSGSQT
jgi:hypothetical protein